MPHFKITSLRSTCSTQPLYPVHTPRTSGLQIGELAVLLQQLAQPFPLTSSSAHPVPSRWANGKYADAPLRERTIQLFGRSVQRNYYPQVPSLWAPGRVDSLAVRIRPRWKDDQRAQAVPP